MEPTEANVRAEIDFLYDAAERDREEASRRGEELLEYIDDEEHEIDALNHGAAQMEKEAAELEKELGNS